MSEAIYPARVVRQRLGISDGMLRRYALALEAVTGEPIKQHPRDGRQYTREQVEVLERAKLRVGEKRGRDVETAIRLSLGQSEEDAETAMLPERVSTALPVSPDALAAALEPVITPLLTELRALRESNERLQSEVAGLREDIAARPLEMQVEGSQKSPEAIPTGNTEHGKAGTLVRVATQLEHLWQRVRGRT